MKTLCPCGKEIDISPHVVSEIAKMCKECKKTAREAKRYQFTKQDNKNVDEWLNQVGLPKDQKHAR